jgi:hypothetical protein
VVELVQYIQEAIDNRKKVSLVSMDLKKAFDIVDTEKLLDCLYNNGIRGNANKILRSYITNRSQVVKIGNKQSDPICFSQGVVQGSILGPWLFTLFFNSISKLNVTGRLYLYADDCVLVNVHDIQDPVQDAISKDMTIIMNYLNSQRLILNVNKTNFIIFHSAYLTINDPNEIQIQNATTNGNSQFCIKRKNKIKYLGLMMDENLKWESHVSHVESKLASSAGALWKLKHHLSTNVKKRIYTSLFESHLLYLLPVWGSSNDNLIDSIQVIQNRALRNVYGLDRLANRVHMYNNLVEKFMPIRALFFMNTSALLYKCINHKIHTNLQFEEINSEVTRSEGYLRPIRSRSLYGARSFCAIGPRMYNTIPKVIQRSHHVHSFKYFLRIHLQNEDFIDSCFSHRFLERFS